MIRKNKKGGSNCVNQFNVNTGHFQSCIPNVDVSQYKYPCMFLPLDGSVHNMYPLSNNPSSIDPVGISTLKGGQYSRNKIRNKKKKQSKKKSKKQSKKQSKKS